MRSGRLTVKRISLEILKSDPDWDAFDHRVFMARVRPGLVGETPVFGVDKIALLDRLGDPAYVERERLQGHMTTSCLVLHPREESVLLVKHRKIGEWIYPGGHADGDWFWLRSSLRECAEETGFFELGLIPPSSGDALLPHFLQRFEIKTFQGTPAHVHDDAVYVFEAPSEDVTIAPEESDGHRWVSRAWFEEMLKGGLESVDGVSALTARLCLRGIAARRVV